MSTTAPKTINLRDLLEIVKVLRIPQKTILLLEGVLFIADISSEFDIKPDELDEYEVWSSYYGILQVIAERLELQIDTTYLTTGKTISLYNIHPYDSQLYGTWTVVGKQIIYGLWLNSDYIKRFPLFDERDKYLETEIRSVEGFKEPKKQDLMLFANTLNGFGCPFSTSKTVPSGYLLHLNPIMGEYIP